MLIISLSVTVQAYVPKEYQNKPYMTDYDIYKISKEHINEAWAKDNIEDYLIIKYTNGWRCHSCLDEVMQRKFDTEIKIKVDKVQKLPSIKN